MTETPILPGGATATDDGVGMLPTPPDFDGVDSDGGNRRRLMIIGAIAGVIILAAAAYLLLHKSSSSTPTAAVVPHGVASAPATTPVSNGVTDGFARPPFTVLMVLSKTISKAASFWSE